MTSALTPRGSTRAWRTIRQAYDQQLAYLGQVPCWRDEHNSGTITTELIDQSPNCTGWIKYGQPWVLGHKHDRALGGNDQALGYECDPCSRYTGGKTGARIRRARRQPRRRQW